ncbi:hypothetical protein [Enterococcus sp. AZ192]|uniref:hypothetical protein n=1 Tax=unclassified Enterococcus TaxID=2608891 RepID=UPI003D27769D
MRLYINPKKTETKLSYRELAEKMWFKEKNGHKLEISHVGNDESLQDNLFLSLSIDKWLNDSKWKKIESPLQFEDIDLEFLKEENLLFIMSKHQKILTVDKRALYIMAVELAKDLDGSISEDEKSTWLSVAEFEKKHQVVLNLTYEEANDISLKEVKTMEAIEEPWDYDDE